MRSLKVVKKVILIRMLIKKENTYDFNIIEERKSENSEEVKKENIQHLTELKSILRDKWNFSSSKSYIEKQNKKIMTLMIKV